MGDKDFERRLEIIERSIRELEAAADPAVRATAQQLVQAILELHGRGLERLLEIVHASVPVDVRPIDACGRDPLVRHLLLLHSLHPLSLEERVLQAIEDVRPSLKSQGASLELLGIVEGVVRIRMLGGPAQKAAVERAVLDAAPDASAIEVDAEDASMGFVSLAALRGREPSRPAV